MDNTIRIQFLQTVVLQLFIYPCKPHFEQHLFKDYSQIVKPRKNQSEPVNVSIEMHLKTVHEVDEHLQYISFTAWFYVQWEDEFLTWNETDHSGIKEITVRQEKVWVPDLYLLYSEGDFYTSGAQSFVSVTSKGHMSWIPGGKFKVTCDLKMKKFPFDNQTCVLILSPWLRLDSDQKFIPVNPVQDVKYITQNGEWEFTRFLYRVEHQTEYDMTFLFYELHLKRRYLYFVFSTLVPIIALAVLNSMTFLIPLESGERIQYSLTLLLAFTVFLTLFEQTMPQSSTDVPYLSQYVGFQLFLCVVSTVMSIISRSRMNKYDTKESKFHNESSTLECGYQDRRSEKFSKCNCKEQLNNNTKPGNKFQFITNFTIFLLSIVLQFLSITLLFILFWI